MSAPISKQLLTSLLATTVLSVIAVLKPETEVAAVSDDALVVERQAHPSGLENKSLAPWLRQLQPQSVVNLSQGFVPPAPPPPPLIVLTPIEPPKPVAPNPSFTYLGRLMREDKVYVFLGRGENVDVVAIGDAIDSSWRVEGVSDTGVELRYLPLNEVRQLAMSDQ